MLGQLGLVVLLVLQPSQEVLAHSKLLLLGQKVRLPCLARLRQAHFAGAKWKSLYSMA